MLSTLSHGDNLHNAVAIYIGEFETWIAEIVRYFLWRKKLSVDLEKPRDAVDRFSNQKRESWIGYMQIPARL